LELVVTDDDDATSAPDTVNVTVRNVVVPPPNQPPTADAGADQDVNEGTLVTLDGSASSDSDGTVESYAWTQTAGPAVALTGAGTASPTFTAPAVDADTVLTFQLVVTDDDDATSAPDTVNVTVRNVPTPPQDPAEAIQNLISLKESMNLDKGTTTSLDAKLDTALKSVTSGHDNAAKNQLKAFINQVNALSGKKLTENQAEQLTSAAREIIDMI
jgi:hypothetical protein